MIWKFITLKFADGRRETVQIVVRDEREASAAIAAELARTGAYGFSTQSTGGRR